MNGKQQVAASELIERVVAINRISKTVKGGKRLRFSVLVVVGDGENKVGLGMGKAREISEAVRKGMESAKKNMVLLKRDGKTIPHPILGRFGSTQVLLRPAADGTGVIAGGVVRAIMELGGVKDVMTKVVARSNTPVNVARATFAALESLRTRQEIMTLRGKNRPAAEEVKANG